MRFVRPTDPMAMAGVVESLRQAEPTYTEIGASLVGVQPAGFHHDRDEITLGHGQETYRRAVDGLKTWKAHAVPGLRVFPPQEAIRVGATVVVTLGTPFLAVAAPCRIVGVTDEKRRWGFAYGTLSGHPEEGEESFVVSISPDETVRFAIVAFSRPGGQVVRLAGPLGRGIQKWGTGGYLESLRRYVHGEDRAGSEAPGSPGRD